MKYLLPKQAPNIFMYEYDPDIDSSDPLDPEKSSYFQYLVVVMRWMIEIGYTDIATEVSMLSSFLAYPREVVFLAYYGIPKAETQLYFVP